MNNLEIYFSLLEELKKVVHWCKNPDEIEDFDIDQVFKNILDKYKIPMKYGFLNPIFSLVDVMCDCIRHEREEISIGYTVEDGINDLQQIIDLIEHDRITELETNYKLKNRLNSLYG